MPMRMNITTTISFRHEDQNSSSAKPSVPKILTITIIINVMSLRKRADQKSLRIATQNIVIQTANGTLFGQ